MKRAWFRDEDIANPLEAEMAVAIHQVTFPTVKRLADLGAPMTTVARLYGWGDLGIARVQVGHDGFWEWEGSEPRLMLAVRESGYLVDIIALRSGDQNSWALRTGAGWLLGFDRFLRVQVEGEGVLRLFGTPIDWLLGDRDGICVLDWTEEAVGMLRGLGPHAVLLADDRKAAERLTKALSRGGLPQVGSARRDRRAA